MQGGTGAGTRFCRLAQMAVGQLLNRKTGLLANFRCRSNSEVRRATGRSALPERPDIVSQACNVRKVPGSRVSGPIRQ
jgi:hypothetical protein